MAKPTYKRVTRAGRGVMILEERLDRAFTVFIFSPRGHVEDHRTFEWTAGCVFSRNKARDTAFHWARKAAATFGLSADDIERKTI